MWVDQSPRSLRSRSWRPQQWNLCSSRFWVWFRANLGGLRNSHRLDFYLLLPGLRLLFVCLFFSSAAFRHFCEHVLLPWKATTGTYNEHWCKSVTWNNIESSMHTRHFRTNYRPTTQFEFLCDIQTQHGRQMHARTKEIRRIPKAKQKCRINTRKTFSISVKAHAGID